MLSLGMRELGKKWDKKDLSNTLVVFGRRIWQVKSVMLL